MSFLIPPPPLRVSREQAALTKRFLTPALDRLHGLLLRLRQDVDARLTAELAGRYTQPYPYGCCLEITNAMAEQLQALAARRDGPAEERALRAFFRHGGEVRILWGVLREQFFQNALQIGGLYVDVSNDTVDIRKPKIQILPLEESGFALVRDAFDFATIAERYWQARVYANSVLPELAPLYPMIAVDRHGVVQIQSNAAYMLRLLGGEGFRLAEAWLAEAPAAPEAVMAALREHAPAELRRATSSGTAEAVDECRRLRAGDPPDAAWVMAMRGVFQKTPMIRVAATEAKSPPETVVYSQALMSVAAA
ncbi:MAG: hypothetical protein ACOVOE_07665 [Caulobacter sp.]